MQMNEAHQQLNKQLNKAKAKLMSNREAVFFISVLFSLKFKWDDKCPTAYTNGYVLGFNPEFFLKLSIDEQVFVLVHEACHVAYDHMGRLQGRNMRRWNIAADHVINLYLKDRGFKMPDWVCKDARFKDMSSEQVYKILEDEDDQTENGMEDIQEPGTDADGNSVSPDEIKRHIEEILVNAGIQQKMQGGKPYNLPGEIELLISRLLKPRLPWQTILRREVQEVAKVNYTWARPNRRYYPDHYLPSMGGIALQKLTFYVDISGSVSDDQFKIFVSEIAGTLKMFNLKSVRIVQFDTQIQHDDTVDSLAKLVKLKFHGRGGTDCECIFEHMEKTKPQLALIFTDGGFHWRRDTHKQRMLWLINDNPSFKPMFGRAICFSTSGE